jgi:NADPH:quinone reductase-like Zn-dependent oxidoreductase
MTAILADWLHITAQKLSVNSGDDIAGTVAALGAGVAATGEFSIGDRVAAFHPMLMPGGAYAEYATSPAHTVFKIPERTSFEGQTRCSAQSAQMSSL